MPKAIMKKHSCLIFAIKRRILKLLRHKKNKETIAADSTKTKGIIFTTT